MAHKKATVDHHQRKCQDEAREIIKAWFKHRKDDVDLKHIHIVWFAYIKHGYKCMLTSSEHDNIFFEVTVNKNADEICCNCFKRFEYFVKPSTSSKLHVSFSPTPLREAEKRNDTLI